MSLELHAAELAEIKSQMLRLRKTLRWAMLGWAVTASGLLMGAAYTQATFFESVKVRRLALVDTNGIERLILETDSKTANVNGKVVARGPAVSGIIIQNEKGDEVGGIGTNTNGIAAIMLDGYSDRSKHGMSERVGLVSLPDGRAGLVLMDLKGNLRGQMLTDAKMDVTFGLAGADEQPRISGKVSGDARATWMAVPVE